MKNEKLSYELNDARNFLEYHPGVSPVSDFFKHLYIDIVNVCKNGIERYMNEPIENIEAHGMSYKDFYGYDWQYNKTIYVGTYDLYKYDPPDDLKQFVIQSKGINPIDVDIFLEDYEQSWITYDAGCKEADTYEELIISIADDVRTKFGDFSYQYFLRDMDPAPEKIIPRAIHNLRWWDWYKNTSFYKKSLDIYV